MQKGVHNIGNIFKFTNLDDNKEVIVLLDKLFILEIDENDKDSANITLTGNGGAHQFKISKEVLQNFRENVGDSKSS